MRKDENIFIVYELVDNNNIPFYVGRTSNLKRRLYDHNRNVTKGKKDYKCNKIRKLIKEENYILKCNIIYDYLSFADSVNKEIETIKLYKESGLILTNLTNGGEGLFGVNRVFTENHKNNLKNTKKKLFESGYIQPTKGKTNIEIYGKEKADKLKLQNRNSQLELIKNNKKSTTKGKKLHELVSEEKYNELIIKFSDNAKKQFTGKKQSEDQIKKRSINQSNTKQNWSEEKKKEISKTNKLNAEKSIKRKNIKVILPNNDSFIFFMSYSELTIYLLNTFNIKCNPKSISNIINNKLDFTKTHHKCNFINIENL